MANVKTQDMTQGSLARAMIAFSIPLIISGVLQQLYNWVDAFIVGNVVGELALAAVGMTTAVINLFVFGITGFTSGLSILAGQMFGRRKEADLHKIISSFLVVGGAVVLIAALLCMIFSNPLLILMETPADIYDMALTYLRIVMIGIPILMVYNVYASVLRGIGDSRAPFLSVAVSSVVNVVLDIVFVWSFRWGVAGAAAATVLAQFMMMIFIIWYTNKKYSHLRLQSGEFIDKSILRQGSALGIPVAIQSCLSSVGTIILQNFMNGFGTQTVAAITTAYRIDSIILLPIINVGTAISTAVAQNTGAGDAKRARKSLWTGNAIMVAVSVLLTLLVISVGAQLIALFGVTAESTAIGARFFKGIAQFYIVFGIATAFRGYLEGRGDVLFSSSCAIFSVIVRIIASYMMEAHYGNMTIAYAEGLSWCVMIVLFALRTFYFTKKISVKSVV